MDDAVDPGSIELVAYPVFEDRPDDEYLDRWFKHIADTGYPERFENVTTTRPEVIGRLRLLSGEMSVPILRRHNRERVPCPICHPEKPWFQVGRAAWFPEEKVVRFIGHQCAKTHFREHYDEAEKRYQFESRIRHLILRWNAISWHADVLERVCHDAMRIAAALQLLRQNIDTEARGLAKFLYREFSRNDGLIEIVSDTGFKDQRGDAVFDKEVLGVIQGAGLFGPRFVPAEQLISLRAVIADLRIPLPPWRGDDHDDEVEAEILTRAGDADKLPERLIKAIARVGDAKLFLAQANLELLERWGKNNQSPFQSLVCRMDDGRLYIRSGTYDGWHFTKPVVDGAAFDPLPEIPHSILELRRSSVRHLGWMAKGDVEEIR